MTLNRQLLSTSTPSDLMCTQDKCYGSIPDFYKSVCRPALEKSDHNVVHLLPRYRAKLKEEKPVTKDIWLWTDDCREELRDCLEETDKQIFFDSCANPHELADIITSYIMF